MSFIQNLFTSRDNNANGNSYVGQEDRIWWNPDTNAFYYSDGNTAGGILITGGSSGNGVPGGVANSVQYNAGNSTFGGDSNFTFDSSTSTLTITNIVANTLTGGAGGSNTQVQFNTNGNFTGNSNFTYNSVSKTLTMTGSAYLGNVLAAANVTTANLTATGISNLNSNANVKISGGIPGQSLATDGAGNLFWTSGTGGNTVIINGTSTNTVNIDFTYNSTTLLYLPTGAVTVTLANYTAGHTARVIVRYGTPYTLAMGVANVQQTTEGATTIPISGAGGHKINGNQSVQLLYTCFDNTAANCYVASTFL